MLAYSDTARHKKDPGRETFPLVQDPLVRSSLCVIPAVAEPMVFLRYLPLSRLYMQLRELMKLIESRYC